MLFRPARLLLLILLLLFGVCLQPGADESESSAQARLRQLQQAQDGLQSMHARFTQTRRFVHFGEEESREGELYFKRGRGVRIVYQQPIPELLVISKGRASLYNERTNQLHRYRLPEDSAAGSALWPFVPGPPPAAEDMGALTAIESIDDLPGIAVSRKPGATGDPYVEKRVYINAVDGLPRRIELKDASDDLVIYSLADVEVDPQLDDALFSFEPPSDAEIVEIQGTLSF